MPEKYVRLWTSVRKLMGLKRASPSWKQKFGLNLRKIRSIDELRSHHTTEGKLVVEGISAFKFFDNGKNQVRPLPFTAYGQAAVSINDTGIGGIHTISGRLNIHPPSNQNPSHRTVLNVQQSVCVKSGHQAPSIEPQPVKIPAKEVELAQESAVYDDIPF